MFDQIPEKIRKQMKRLKQIDARDRIDGTTRMKRLRQIPPETGRFIAMIAAAAPAGEIIEIGTSAGYSTLYLALAAREKGTRVTTFEILSEKARMARDTFGQAEVTDVIELIEGDARDHLKNMEKVAFAFIDAEKEVYKDCYDLLVPRMESKAWLIADNIISHRDELLSFVESAQNDSRVDALVVPIGKGLLLCRKT